MHDMAELARRGEPRYVEDIMSDFVEETNSPRFVISNFRSATNWRTELTDLENVAASIQYIVADYIARLARWVRVLTGKTNVVLTGDVATNPVVVRKVAERRVFLAVYVPPNPGEGGSSIGAVAAKLGRHFDQPGPFLGHAINRSVDCEGALAALCLGETIALANGRAEIGAHGLGHRSLLRDPRVGTVDKVVVIEARASRYLRLAAASSPHMSVEGHFIRTGAPVLVQTVTRDSNPILHRILGLWGAATGCHMLANDNLSEEGRPLINTWAEALRFSAKHGIRVF